LPASDGSPLPSISIQADSWIDKTFGDDGEASSVAPNKAQSPHESTASEASTSRSRVPRHQPPELPVNQPVQTQTPAPADSGSDSVNRHQYLSDEMEGKAAPAPEVGQASSSQQPQAITGTSSQAAANPEAAPLQLIQAQPPGHQPPILELLENHAAVADVIRDIHRELHIRVPGGFQAEWLAEILEARHGGERLNEILQSLKTERNQSPYFGEVQTDFKTLRDDGGTEMQLRKEWQGRG